MPLRQGKNETLAQRKQPPLSQGGREDMDIEELRDYDFLNKQITDDDIEAEIDKRLALYGNDDGDETATDETSSLQKDRTSRSHN